jgi:hypothetical protein
VSLAELMTHTCNSCSNNHLCMLSPHTYLHPLTRHQAHRFVSYYTRQCIMIYIGLCNCMLSRITTNNILQVNIRHTFIRALCGRNVIMETLHDISCTLCDVLMNISQKLASIRVAFLVCRACLLLALAVAASKLDIYHMLYVQFLSSWWRAEKPLETCRALTAIRNIV